MKNFFLLLSAFFSFKVFAQADNSLYKLFEKNFEKAWSEETKRKKEAGLAKDSSRIKTSIFIFGAPQATDSLNILLETKVPATRLTGIWEYQSRLRNKLYTDVYWLKENRSMVFGLNEHPYDKHFWSLSPNKDSLFIWTQVGTNGIYKHFRYKIIRLSRRKLILESIPLYKNTHPLVLKRRKKTRS